MAKTSKGARSGLGEPWASDLADFCAANYNASEREVIREAVAAHIHGRLGAEPVLRERFEQARAKRLAQLGKNVTALLSSKKG